MRLPCPSECGSGQHSEFAAPEQAGHSVHRTMASGAALSQLCFQMDCVTMSLRSSKNTAARDPHMPKRQSLTSTDLDKNAANYTPLTPLSLIARTAYTYPQQLAVVHGDRRYTWARDLRALAAPRLGAGAAPASDAGDTVALMAANTPEMFEAHFGVPMSGGVLNTLNTRLDAEAIAFMLEHGEAKVLITDTEFAPIVGAALAQLETKAAGHRHRRRARPGRRAARRARLRGIHRRTAIPTSTGSIPRTNGMRSRSTTRRAPPAIRRASSITIAARI